MLMNGDYPYYLKQRISADNGHLSNTQALELFTKNRSAQLTHLILSHLSKNNNSPELVDRLFNQQAGNTKIIVASRYQETPVYHIQTTTPGVARFSDNYIPPAEVQLSLF
jgi:phosphoribosyl 1,2-cyclic phosphodiesterase